MAAADHGRWVPLTGEVKDLACCLYVAKSNEVALECCRAVVREMGAALLEVGCDVDSFQGFNEEVRQLPGKYSEDECGSLLLCVSGSCSEWEGKAADAVAIGDCVGMIAIKAAPGLEGTAEIKRLFVREGAFRGKRLGRSLTFAIVHEAKRLGYTGLVLDTLVRLPHAVRLYESMGFRQREGYVHNPMEDALFYEASVDDVLKLEE